MCSWMLKNSALSRWRFFDAIDDEEAAWKANCWTQSKGFELIDVKQIQDIDHET